MEILVSDRYLQSPKLFEVFNEYRKKLSVLPEARFNFENARRNLLNLFKVETLDAYGNFSRAEITAARSADGLCRNHSERADAPGGKTG